MTESDGTLSKHLSHGVLKTPVVNHCGFICRLAHLKKVKKATLFKKKKINKKSNVDICVFYSYAEVLLKLCKVWQI